MVFDNKKKPISAINYNIEVRNAKKINIKTNKKIRFNLLYDKNRSYNFLNSKKNKDRTN